MNRARAALTTVALVAAAGLGAALAPVARGQEPKAGPTVRVERALARGGRLGVTVNEVDKDTAQKAHLPAPAGVAVSDVAADSPAAAAGLKAGDVIVEYDGERVRGTRQFVRLVQETPSGRTVQMSVVRDGARQTLTIEPREAGGVRVFEGDLAELNGLMDGVRAWRMPPPPPPAPPSGEAPQPPRAPQPPAAPDFRWFDFDGLIGRGGARLGVRVTTLEPQLGDYFGSREGVLVTSVEADSVAAKAGVKAGDVITALNGKQVTSPSELRAETQRLEDNAAFTLGIVRDKKPMTLNGKLEGSTRHRTVTVL